MDNSTISPLAGRPAPDDMRLDVTKLIAAYYNEIPDPTLPDQRISFGTSGHRGSAFHKSFNEAHILAITQAICLYRAGHGINGPLFLGKDTHALSEPAWITALEVLAANGVTVMMAPQQEFTPTPAVSHAILTHNAGGNGTKADGIVITPSHNPPEDGGFKYNPPSGGPAGGDVTRWIQDTANHLLETGIADVPRSTLEKALAGPSTHVYDYMEAYVADLAQVIDMEIIRTSGVSLGVDPLGGAGVRYWGAIADRYGLNMTVVDETVDPTFQFMTVDWDGRLRMDPSSVYAMQRLLAIKDRFQIACACDTDHDRHGIVTRGAGLLPPNHYLAVCIHYLLQHRPPWSVRAAVGKTLVSSAMIDRVTAGLNRRLYEVPVGFKWFVDGLLDGSLVFGGEESAGASFSCMDGSPWSTDKDGMIACLLAAEITARLQRDPGDLYADLTKRYGNPVYQRIDAPADREQKALLAALEPRRVTSTTLAGEPIEAVLSHAPGNGAAIGGLKVTAPNGWFAARPSGTEDIYKIYAESFLGSDHLRQIQDEARTMVDRVFTR